MFRTIATILVQRPAKFGQGQCQRLVKLVLHLIAQNPQQLVCIAKFFTMFTIASSPCRMGVEPLNIKNRNTLRSTLRSV